MLRRLLTTTTPALAILALPYGAAQAQSGAGLSSHFGFGEPRTIVVEPGAGPALVGDVDGDGLSDLVIVNNAKSRIEIHAQRAQPRTDEQIRRDLDPNELPPSAHYDRVNLSVAHRVTAFRLFDIDGDGSQDIIYAGQPAEIVVLRQTDRLMFEVLSKRRVRQLSAPQDGFAIADVRGNDRPELLAAVGGKINVFSLSRSSVVGEPIELGSDGEIFYFFIEDYDGDGLSDVCAAIPDDDSPLRLWLQERESNSGAKSSELGPELRFEGPNIREAEPIRTPGHAAASIAVIETASRRMVLSDLAIESIDASASSGSGVERDAHAEIRAFPSGADKERTVAVADINADGLLDMVSTERSLNSLGLFLQQPGRGMSRQQRFSALKSPSVVDAGQWDDDAPLEIFVLSEEDKSVGVSQFDADSGRVTFPQPIPIATPGAEPVAMAYTPLASGPAVSVIVKERRNHTLEVNKPEGDAPRQIELEGVNRPPSSMRAGDFDHDGATDLALFTPGEPLVLVLNVDSDTARVLTDDAMPQFGLVQAAGPDNTSMLDVDGDGYEELLIADENFVRACAFDAARGWRVVDQVTMPESSSDLVGLSVLQSDDGTVVSIVAFDRGNGRLVVMAPGEDGAWGVADRLRLGGFEPSRVFAGAFSGDGAPNVLGVSDGALAIIKLGGMRVGLEEFAAYRSEKDDLVEHEIESGDLNSDGYVDLVVLDAAEQLCEIFTLSAARRLLAVTEFKVFESRLFQGGETRDFEPRYAIVADLTGDGADDLTVQVHDRFIIYPQMTPQE